MVLGPSFSGTSLKVVVYCSPGVQYSIAEANVSAL